MCVYQQRWLKILAVTALALGLSACGPSGDGPTAGQRLDQAVDKTNQAADNVKAEAERAVEAASQHVNNAVDATQKAVENAATTVDDAVLTAKVNAALLTEPELSALQVQVDTQDGVVTMRGEALNEGAKERAEDLVKHLDGVRGVRNLLVVK